MCLLACSPALGQKEATGHELTELGQLSQEAPREWQCPGAQDTERRQFPAQQALVTGKLSPCCKSFPPGSTTSRGEGLCSQLGTPAGQGGFQLSAAQRMTLTFASGKETGSSVCQAQAEMQLAQEQGNLCPTPLFWIIPGLSAAACISSNDHKHTLLHRASHRPGDSQMQVGGGSAVPCGRKGAEGLVRSHACGQEGHPGGVTPEDLTEPSGEES